MSAGHKVLAVGSVIMAVSVVGTAAAFGLKGILQFAGMQGSGDFMWTAVVGLPVGASLGFVLWLWVVRSFDLLSWDDIEELFGYSSEKDAQDQL